MLRALASSPVVVESPLEKKNLRGSRPRGDRKSTRLNSSHDQISYAVFCLKKKKIDYRRVKKLKRHRNHRDTASLPPSCAAWRVDASAHGPDPQSLESDAATHDPLIRPRE